MKNPRILEGEPTVSDTRVPVRAIVLTYRLYSDLDRLLEAFPMLNRQAIEAALEFYDTHRDEIDRYIAEHEEPEEPEGR